MSRSPNYPSQNVNQGNSQENSTVSTYYGLINQGATCYLNSVLQVLFMTEGFREAVSRKNVSQNGIDLQLCKLFKKLSNQTAETTGVTKKLRIKKVNEQHDAAEYFERILTKTNDEAKQIFKGELTYRTICQCKSKTEEIVSFWNLPLPLTDVYDKTYTVMDGIQEFLKNSEFTGENQLYCETCGNKCDATIQCKVKHHPEVVMLLLKRFEFNYRHMEYMKNSLPVDVSLTITLPENQTYELYALVEHMGTLNSGHYMATIKPQNEDRWYEFDDSSVTKLENKKVKKRKLQQSQLAYLLFYRKSNACTQNEEVSVTAARPSLKRNNTGSCQNVNRSENNVGTKELSPSSPYVTEVFLEVNDSKNPAQQIRQRSSLPNGYRFVNRNTNDSSTRQKNPREIKNKSGSFKSRDSNTAPFHHNSNRKKEHVTSGLKRTLSCENISMNDRTEHRRNAHVQEQPKAKGSEQNISRNQQQQINERATGQVHNKVQGQDHLQLQTKEQSEAKSSLKGNLSQERSSGVKPYHVDDGQKNDHHLTTGQQEVGRMRQEDQSHGTITHKKGSTCVPNLEFCWVFWKPCKGKPNIKCEESESEETETTHVFSQDNTKKDKRDRKKKRGKSTRGNGDKQDKKCCIC